jgi:hypothetical protein
LGARAHWMLQNNTENALPKIICPLAYSLKKPLIAEGMIVRTTAV